MIRSVTRRSTPGTPEAPRRRRRGLHFTVELIDRIQRKGVELAFVTLHVGLDTFRPVTSEDPAAHHIHTEYYQVGPEATNTINLARERGGRVFAVGTTSVRVLEQAASQAGFLKSNRLDACAGWADIFILPGHRFRLVDAMITNFHLPRSTLLMLVSAFAEQPQTTNSGLSAILAVYQEASSGTLPVLLVRRRHAVALSQAWHGSKTPAAPNRLSSVLGSL